MEYVLIGVVLAVAVFVIIKLIKNRRAKTREEDSTNKEKKPEVQEAPLKGKNYKAKECLLTENEYSFYLLLEEAFPDVNIQVQQVLYSFIEQEKEYFNQRPTGLYKSVDFLLCDDEFTPLVAIEINDKSHNSLDRQARDKFVTTLMERCEIPLETFLASEEVTVGDIKKRLKKYI